MPPISKVGVKPDIEVVRVAKPVSAGSEVTASASDEASVAASTSADDDTVLAAALTYLRAPGRGETAAGSNRAVAKSTAKAAVRGAGRNRRQFGRVASRRIARLFSLSSPMVCLAAPTGVLRGPIAALYCRR